MIRFVQACDQLSPVKHDSQMIYYYYNYFSVSEMNCIHRYYKFLLQVQKTIYTLLSWYQEGGHKKRKATKRLQSLSRFLPSARVKWTEPSEYLVVTWFKRTTCSLLELKYTRKRAYELNCKYEYSLLWPWELVHWIKNYSIRQQVQYISTHWWYLMKWPTIIYMVPNRCKTMLMQLLSPDSLRLNLQFYGELKRCATNR